MEKDKKKKLRRRNNIIKSLVLVIAFVVAVSGTFGMTMAYFGGKSGSKTHEMILKTGLWIDSGSDVSGSAIKQYVVPSQVVKPTCEVTIKSSKNKTGADSDPVTNSHATDRPSSGLLRVGIKFTSENDEIKLSGGATSFKVYNPDDEQVGNFVLWGNKEGDEVLYYYFVPTAKTTLSAAGTDETNDLLQEVNTSQGAVTYKFQPQIAIPPQLGNGAGGQVVTLEIFYQVIQFELYDIDGNPLKPTVKAVSGLMDGMTGDDYNVEY